MLYMNIELIETETGCSPILHGQHMYNLRLRSLSTSFLVAFYTFIVLETVARDAKYIVIQFQ